MEKYFQQRQVDVLPGMCPTGHMLKFLSRLFIKPSVENIVPEVIILEMRLCSWKDWDVIIWQTSIGVLPYRSGQVKFSHMPTLRVVSKILWK